MRLVPPWAKPGVGGLVTGALAVAAIYWLGVNGVTGGGYGTLSLALSGSLASRRRHTYLTKAPIGSPVSRTPWATRRAISLAPFS
jgi:hypothetical protein